MILVRKVLWMALLVPALCSACDKSQPVDRSNRATPDAGAKEPPLFTVETLGGTLSTPADGSVIWARTFPGEHSSPPYVRVGPGGEVILHVAIRRRPTEPKWVSDYWLMRFDGATGDVVWMQTVESYGQLTLDSQGNILFAWSNHLSKIDPSGALLWSKTFAMNNAYPRLSVGIDGSDDVLVLKQDLDSPTPNTTDDAKGLLELEKLDPGGNSVWSRPIGEGAIQFDGAYVAADRAGNVFVLATLVANPVDFGGGPLAADGVLAKYDAAGNHLFSKGLGLGGPIQYPVRNPLQTDLAGNVFVTSPSYGDIDVGLGSLFCTGDYVLKFDPTGALLFNTCAVAGDFDVTADGGYVTSATLMRDQTLGEKKCAVLDQTSEGTEGAIARYDADGTWIATTCAADSGYQYFGNVAGDSSGALYMTAAFSSPLTLPDGSVAPSLNDGWWTAMVAKIHLDRAP